MVIIFKYVWKVKPGGAGNREEATFLLLVNFFEGSNMSRKRVIRHVSSLDGRQEEFFSSVRPSTSVVDVARMFHDEFPGVRINHNLVGILIKRNSNAPPTSRRKRRHTKNPKVSQTRRMRNNRPRRSGY